MEWDEGMAMKLADVPLSLFEQQDNKKKHTDRVSGCSDSNALWLIALTVVQYEVQLQRTGIVAADWTR